MKILVVENSLVLCNRILALLNASRQYEAVGCVGGSQLALEQVITRKYDGLLLDLHLPEGRSFELLAVLSLHESMPPVIVLSEEDDEQYHRRANALGARAFILKTTGFEEIIPTLDHILNPSEPSLPAKRSA